MVFNLSDHNSVVNKYLLELRDKSIQQDSMRFRNNLERTGEVLAYEISKTLDYTPVEITTPISRMNINSISEEPVLITILRAGLPFIQGFLNVFDGAQTGFIGAFREEGDASVSIRMNYLATPMLDGKTVIIADPMLATGSSLVKYLEVMFRNHQPSKLYLASVIAAPEGIEKVKVYMKNHSIKWSLWTAAIDERLNEQFYIVPGLGDAGDLSYGKKL